MSTTLTTAITFEQSMHITARLAAVAAYNFAVTLRDLPSHVTKASVLRQIDTADALLVGVSNARYSVDGTGSLAVVAGVDRSVLQAIRDAVLLHKRGNVLSLPDYNTLIIGPAY